MKTYPEWKHTCSLWNTPSEHSNIYAALAGIIIWSMNIYRRTMWSQSVVHHFLLSRSVYMCLSYNLIVFYVLVHLYSVAVGANMPLLCSHRVYRHSMSSQVYTSQCTRSPRANESHSHSVVPQCGSLSTRDVNFLAVVQLELYGTLLHLRGDIKPHRCRELSYLTMHWPSESSSRRIC